jgi:chromosome segregation ATPase
MGKGGDVKLFKRPAKIIYEALKGSRAPALTLDAIWQDHFRDRKTPALQALEDKIREVMMDNARNREEFRRLGDKKKERMNQILALSSEAQTSPEARKAMAQCQADVLAINKQLDVLDDRAGALPTELDDANRELLSETLAIIHEQMRKAQSRLDELEPEAERLRKELEKTVMEMSRCEEDASKSYQLLHNLAGQEIVDLLDSLSELKGKGKK